MKRVCVGNRRIAVGRWEDRVVAIDDRCPHQGASLSGGRLRPAMKAGEDSDPAIDPGAPVVICPWHRWEFDGGSGCSTWDASYKVRAYPTDVRDGVVWVQVP
jgi:3-phenylpropionate/trans-cinnamate dioxygenase ferredoxin subunit